MSELWTLSELVDRVADALGGAGTSSGRVQDVPNERLVRWYTTTGLVDPPSSRQGRIARYSERHLLQLVAIKRLQQEGLALAEIQARLTGSTDTALAKVAKLPAPKAESAAVPARRFWSNTPDPAPVVGHMLQLAPGVALVIHSDHQPTHAQRQAIAAASTQLINVLRAQGISQPQQPEGETS